MRLLPTVSRSSLYCSLLYELCGKLYSDVRAMSHAPGQTVAAASLEAILRVLGLQRTPQHARGGCFPNEMTLGFRAQTGVLLKPPQSVARRAFEHCAVNTSAPCVRSNLKHTADCLA